jgi:DNA-binding MarR family transcriptional regulator
MRLATRKLSGVYDAALEPLGINIAQYFLLRSIDGHRVVSLTQLGRFAEQDRSSIGRSVRVLERLKLVNTTRGKIDQREALVCLSKEGHDLLLKAHKIWERCQQRFVSRLGQDKIEALSAVLDAI